MEEIVAVDRNHFGDIISFRTSSGRVISYQKALQEIQEGKIAGAEIQNPGMEGSLPLIKPLDDQITFDHYPPIY